jgi:hypothetical protein
MVGTPGMFQNFFSAPQKQPIPSNTLSLFGKASGCNARP